MPTYTPPGPGGADFELTAYTPPAAGGGDFELADAGSPITATPAAVVVEVVAGAASVMVGRRATPAAVVVEVVPAVPAVQTPQQVAPAAVVVEVVVGAASVMVGIRATPAAVVVEVEPAVPTASNAFMVRPDAVVVEAAPGSAVVIRPQAAYPGGVFIDVVPGVPDVRRFTDRMAGATALIIERPDGQVAAVVTAVVGWSTSRGLNRAGSWDARFAVDAAMVDGEPIGRVITRGWRVSIIQEGSHPMDRPDLEYLMRRGIVERREFVLDDAGRAVCSVSGMFRTGALVDSVRPLVQVWQLATVRTIVSDLVGSLGPEPIMPPAADRRRISITFNPGGDAPLTRLARLLRVVELTRFVVRESWLDDAIELINVDAPPPVRYRLLAMEYADAAAVMRAGSSGVALLGGQPRIVRNGEAMANRIIAFGTDGDGLLDLSRATSEVPYRVRAVTEGSQTVYAVEDPESIARHGLIERVVVRQDVKAASPRDEDRVRAADVLHAVACAELMTRRAPRLQVQVTVANGPHVWALPGDRIRMQYSGVVRTDAGVAVWEDIDADLLVTERRDRGTPSGVRQVDLTLEAPEEPIPVLDMDTGQPTVSLPPAPPSILIGGGGGGGGRGIPSATPGGSIGDCCGDPTTDVEDGDAPAAAPPFNAIGSRVLLYGADTGGERRMYRRAENDGTWTEYEGSPPTGVADVSGSLTYTGGTSVLYRSAVSGSGSPFQSTEYAGHAYVSRDYGQTWAPVAGQYVDGGAGLLFQHASMNPVDGVVWGGWMQVEYRSDPGLEEPDEVAYGHRGYLRRSSDGGATWSAVPGVDPVEGAPTHVWASMYGVTMAISGRAESNSGTVFDAPPRVLVVHGETVEVLDMLAPGDWYVVRGERVHVAGAAIGSRVVSASVVQSDPGDENTRKVLVVTRDYQQGSGEWAAPVVRYEGEVKLGNPVGFAMHPRGSSVFVAFTGGVLRSRDGGVGWELMKKSPRNIRGIAYDERRDALWVWSVSPAMVSVWPSATFEVREPFDATSNLLEVSTLAGRVVAGAHSVVILPGGVFVQLGRVGVDAELTRIDIDADVGS